MFNPWINSWISPNQNIIEHFVSVRIFPKIFTFISLMTWYQTESFYRIMKTTIFFKFFNFFSSLFWESVLNFDKSFSSTSYSSCSFSVALKIQSVSTTSTFLLRSACYLYFNFFPGSWKLKSDKRWMFLSKGTSFQYFFWKIFSIKYWIWFRILIFQ